VEQPRQQLRRFEITKVDNSELTPRSTTINTKRSCSANPSRFRGELVESGDRDFET